MNGILIINKKKGITSRDVVNKVVKVFNTKKVGHTGTLDPIATGVLVICVGKATKLVNMLTSTNKEYIASVCLGISTDTLDSEGNILKEEISIKTKEEIISVLNSFKCTYNQEVPKYSAVKIDGRKLYEYARNNIEVKLPKREVTINSIELIDDIKYENNKTYFKFKCNVSKGTYIRSLINDISTQLNTIGIMTDLKRIKQGDFSIDNSINEEEISIDKLIKIKDILNIKTLELDQSIEKKVLNGANIDIKDEILFIKDNQEIALYENGKCKIMFKGGNL